VVKKILITFCAGVLLGANLSMYAAEVSDLQVQRKNKRFYLQSSLLINAPLESMYKIILDYDSLHQFSRGIKHSQYLDPSSSGVPRAYTHIRGCVAFFCRSLEKVEYIETTKNRFIKASLESKLSKKVAWSVTTWDFTTLEDAGDTRTKIDYKMEFEPKFWVPPFLGNYLVKRTLLKEGLEILERMEKAALGEMKIDPAKNKKKSLPQFAVSDK